MTAGEKKCVWVEDSDGTWTSDCELNMLFDDPVYLQEDYRYCCKCGKRIEWMPYEEETDDEQSE